MILGVVSDTHNRVDNVDKIVEIFNLHETELVIHTGDITQAKTLDRFSNLKCPLIGVFGNNDQNEIGLKEKAVEINSHFQDPPMFKDFEGKKIAILHDPLDIDNILNENKSLDLVIHGHTHRYRYEKINGVIVFNPGESAGSIKGKNAIGLIDLHKLSFSRIFF